MLVRGSQVHQNYLAAHLMPENPDMRDAFLGLLAHLHWASLYDAGTAAMRMIYHEVQQQATVLSYTDNFRFMTFQMLICVPLVLFFRRPRKGQRNAPEASAE